MDVSYNPHAERARRKNRSSTNIHHLSLAPLTSKLPLNDDDAIFDGNAPLVRPSTSYLQGKSAPATPRLLASTTSNPRTRSRSHHRTPSVPGASLTKSKSSSHISGSHAKRSASGTTTPRKKHDDRPDGDWLLRTGALMTFEAREYKGQAWLISRQSSTSLAGMRDVEEEALEHELAREREIASRRVSRRGSLAVIDDDISIINSRVQSRSQSIVGSRSQVHTPPDRPSQDSYFPGQGPISGPDFIDLDEKLEELERDTVEDDEADVKRLMKRNNSGKGTWIGNVMSSIFAVDENDEEEEDEEEEDESSESGEESNDVQTDRGAWLKRHCEGPLDPEEVVPPPVANEGGWSDAAWLLSVATKVIF